jgi:Peptidase family M28/PA domain
VTVFMKMCGSPGVACALLLFVAAASSGGEQPLAAHPRDREIHDSDTRAWWHITEALSNDAMEGRDTGSAAYQRAAEYVAERFRAAGLRPAGDGGGYLQNVPMHEIAAVPDGTSFTLIRADGTTQPLRFLYEISVAPARDAPRELDAALAFRGYCGKEAMLDVVGKIVVCFGTQRAGLPNAAARATNARAAGAVGVVNVDDPYFTIEPPRWPHAYARTVTLEERGAATAAPARPLAVMRVSAEAFRTLLSGTGRDAAAILNAGGHQQPLESFDLTNKLRMKLTIAERGINSPNVLAALPGDRPGAREEYVVIAAHLDGYGFGTAVQGDSLYNGTLDDAAYVALLIQMADDIKARRLPAPHRGLLFAAFTGEEKGLLGSSWFVAHPTIPIANMAADVNLDQLRPLFPLRILTAEALDDTTLGGTARAVAAAMQIEIRADAEPERNLLKRADQYPFLVAHVPAISFVFGYDPGTEAENRYREWYQTRYHRPQDDLTQPVDFVAARKFNRFFYSLVAAIADAPVRPSFLPSSSFATATN